jgi:hypothetical protein
MCQLINNHLVGLISQPFGPPLTPPQALHTACTRIEVMWASRFKQPHLCRPKSFTYNCVLHLTGKCLKTSAYMLLP